MVVLIMSVAMVIIGVFTSNTACATIMIPVVTGVALQSGFNPLTLLFPVTCCCSVAFLLPSSTPPNLIAYTSNTFTTSNLLVSGAILSIICIVLFEINTFTIFPWVIGYDPMEFPEWAKAAWSVCSTRCFHSFFQWPPFSFCCNRTVFSSAKRRVGGCLLRSFCSWPTLHLPFK